MAEPLVLRVAGVPASLSWRDEAGRSINCPGRGQHPGRGAVDGRAYVVTPRKPMTVWQAANTPASLPLYLRRNIAPGAGGCWLWTRSRSRDGYGWASYQKRTWQAHRLIYVLTVGLVQDGLVLDHICRVRHCVNPAHLEPVTMRENLRRGNTPTGATTCQFGHPLEWAGRQRRCLVCWEADRKARNKREYRAARARREARRSP